jgi:hypothetical protein
MRVSIAPWFRLLSVSGRVVIVGVLGSAAVVKIVHGHSASYWLSSGPYYVVSAAELVLCPLLWSRWRIPTLRLLVATLIGIGIYLLSYKSAPGPCGCFGSWPLSRNTHFMVTSLLGLTAMGVLWVEGRHAVKHSSVGGCRHSRSGCGLPPSG